MKSCNAEHRLDRADKIQLGTLNYYRRHLDPEIGDSTESNFEVLIDTLGPQSFSAELLQRMFYDHVIFDEAAVSARSSKQDSPLQRPCTFSLGTKTFFGALENGRCILDIQGMSIATTGSDAMIFCLSIVDNVAEGSKMDYSDQWKMNVSDADDFAKQLSTEFNSFSSDVWPRLCPKDVDPMKYRLAGVHVMHGPVSYTDKTISFVDPKDDDLKGAAYGLEQSDFLKSKRYRYQGEYRFVLRLVHEQRVLALNSEVDHVFLDSNPFKRFMIQQA